MTPPIIWITGPPAAGKTTLTQALAKRFERAVHIPVDDLRLWVVQGMADAVPWTDESERQFQIAEQATCAVARTYQDAGFAVIVDHCRNMVRLDEVIATELAGRSVFKVCLLPSLEVNLRRNQERTNKPFDPSFLDDTIRFVNEMMRTASARPGWTVIENDELTVEQTIALLPFGQE